MVPNSRYIEKLEAHQEKTSSNIKYSIDRFDLLIISVSSGGLVFSLDFVKDIITQNTIINSLTIKIAWILFGLSIVLNLVSQLTAFYANKFEFRITKNLIRRERYKPPIDNIRILEKRKQCLDFTTNLLNGSSLISLIAGLVLLVIFINNYI